MAGENIISIEFVADTAQMSAAFAKVQAELSALSSRQLPGLDPGQTAAAIAPLNKVKSGIDEVGLAARRVPRIFDQGVEIDAFGKAVGGVKAPVTEASAAVVSAGAATVNWTRLTKDHIAAQEFMRGTVGKTAADFKPATAEMRAASIAEEEVGQSASRAGNAVTGFRGNMRALRIDLFAVVAVLAVLKASFDSYAESEAASRHLAAQGMGGASGGLAGAAKAQFFNPKEFDEAAISLKVAGAVFGDVTSEVSELGKSSRISSVPFKELYETVGSLSEEIQMGGVPSLTEMKTLTLASSGATQGLTDRYKELAGSLKLTEQGWKLDTEQRQRNYQIAELHASTVTSLSSKMGFGDAAMIQSGLGSLQALNNLGKGGPGEYLGFGSSGSMGGEISKQMSEGMTQLSKETGLANEDLKMFFFYGKLGYSDLTSASQRYHAQKKQESEFQIKQTQEQLRLDTEREQRSLGLAALQQVMSPSAFKDAQAGLQKASPEAIGQQLMAEMTSAMQTLGKIVAEHFPLVVVAIKALGAVMLLSKVAGANARIFGGAPAAASEAAAAAEGAAAAKGASAGSGSVMGFLSGVSQAFIMAMALNRMDEERARLKAGGPPKKEDPLTYLFGGTAAADLTYALMPHAKNAPSPQGQGAGSSGVNYWGTQYAGGGLAGDKATVEDPTTHDLLQQLLKMLQGG